VSIHPIARRRFMSLFLASPFLGSAWIADAAASEEALITKFGARADGTTLNTKAIQSAIDHLASRRGGTVVVPQGTFVSGALFFKPKVNLHLLAGAVLQCSTDLANFPLQRTRIEGHFEEKFNPALINAKNCDGFQLTGEGTLDGAGQPIWDLFWKMRNASPAGRNFPNVGVPRARLAIIESSRNVKVEGITFKDSQFWNLHLYNCDGVSVSNTRFQVPDDYRQAPSTDGIDIDSSRNVTIDGCYFSVTDDCIAAKGSKGPHAMQDTDSPPVEHIRIRNCVYKRGGGVLTLGSEATIVRDVVVENCRITGSVRIATVKLRPDTPQHYEDIMFRNITSEAMAPEIIAMQPWSQFVNLQGEAPPQSVVRNLNFIGIKGNYTAFGAIRPNPGQTDISDILFKDLDVVLKQGKLAATGVKDLKFENVIVNGQPQTV
jgi:alpha-L-rhamnosidase